MTKPAQSKRQLYGEPDEFTGERSIWWSPADHLEEFGKINAWYTEAMKYCTGKTVLDLGAGYALGSFFLSTVAKRIDSYDVMRLPDAPELRLPFQCPAVFHRTDLEKEEIPEKADVAVAIEFLEHVDNPDFVLGTLKVKSLFFTIPCYGNKNPFHKIEYDEAKAVDLVRRHFPTLEYRMESRRMIGLAHKL